MPTRITDAAFGVYRLHTASGTTYRLDLRPEGSTLTHLPVEDSPTRTTTRPSCERTAGRCPCSESSAPPSGPPRRSGSTSAGTAFARSASPPQSGQLSVRGDHPEDRRPRRRLQYRPTPQDRRKRPLGRPRGTEPERGSTPDLKRSQRRPRPTRRLSRIQGTQKRPVPPLAVRAEADTTRHLLRDAVIELKPRLVFCGYCHQRRTDTLKWPDGSSTLEHVLDDDPSWAGNLVLVAPLIVRA